MPVDSPHDTGAVTILADHPVKHIPIKDKRIDQQHPTGSTRRPPRDDLIPTFLAACVFGPLRMRRLKAPETWQDLADGCWHHPSDDTGSDPAERALGRAVGDCFDRARRLPVLRAGR
jgi:hypothetical protein